MQRDLHLEIEALEDRVLLSTVQIDVSGSVGDEAFDLLIDGQVAASFVLGGTQQQSFTFDSTNAFTADDLLQQGDGRYHIIVAADGSKVKTFSLQIKNGSFVKHAKSDLDYAPHKYFVSPRLIDISQGDTGRSYMVDATWLEVTD